MATIRQRLLKNYLIDPNFQIKYALYFVASGVGAMVLLFTLIAMRVNQVIERTMAMDTGTVVDKAVSGLVYDIALFTFIAFIVNAVFVVVFAIYMTHRVAGPAYVIESYIRELKNGQYDSNRTLRKHDDLQPIMASLRDLAAELKAKRDGLPPK